VLGYKRIVKHPYTYTQLVLVTNKKIKRKKKEGRQKILEQHTRDIKRQNNHANSPSTTALTSQLPPTLVALLPRAWPGGQLQNSPEAAGSIFPAVAYSAD
jgi:hypothetical protein